MSNVHTVPTLVAHSQLIAQVILPRW